MGTTTVYICDVCAARFEVPVYREPMRYPLVAFTVGLSCPVIEVCLPCLTARPEEVGKTLCETYRKLPHVIREQEAQAAERVVATTKATP